MMTPLEQIVLAFHSLSYAARHLFRASLWIPWLVVVGLQLTVIVLLWGFAHPALSWLAARAIERLAGEQALHYPTIFRVMPALYARADLAIGVFVGAVAAGASTALFGARFSGRPLPVHQGLGQALSRAGALILANLPLSLLLLGFSLLLEAWFSNPETPPVLARLAPFFTLGAIGLLQGFFLWVNPLLMLGRYRLGATFASLPDAARLGWWTAFTLALVATLPLLPTQLLIAATDRIVDQGTPETVGWLVLLQTLIAAVAAFLLTGGSALAYQSLIGPGLEDELW